MNEDGRNGGPGRPSGVKNGQGTSLEPIKDWNTKHDTVVALHCSMHSNQEIAEMVGYTPARVSQILNDPQGRRLVEAHRMRMRERLMEDVESGLAEICVDALENIRRTVELEGLSIGSDFMKHQDKVSLEVLKGSGFLTKDKEMDRGGQTEIPKMLAERIATALEKTAKVAEEIEKQEKEREIIQEEPENVREGDFSVLTP